MSDVADLEEGEVTTCSSHITAVGDVLDEEIEEYDYDEDWIMRGTLPVAPLDDDFEPEAEPKTGEEYLRLVRYQSNLLPFAIRAEVDATTMMSTNYVFEESREQSNIVSELLPPRDFINSFMVSFSEGCISTDLYEASGTDVEWPAFGDEAAWSAFLYPDAPDASSTFKRMRLLDNNTMCSIEPDILPSFHPSQQQLMQLIKFHCQWLITTITERQYRFIIRILQCLDPRMTGWQLCKLRSLAQHIINIRAQMKVGDDELFFANAIIVAIAQRFGQTDLLSLT